MLAQMTGPDVKEKLNKTLKYKKDIHRLEHEKIEKILFTSLPVIIVRTSRN
jgi:hypothetical protein